MFLKAIEKQKETSNLSSLLFSCKKIFLDEPEIFEEINRILAPHIENIEVIENKRKTS